MSTTPITFPIAEIFHSIQGEGLWTGTPMMFVRLAGCCVGEYLPEHLIDNPLNVLSTDAELAYAKKHSICTTFDGQRFLCDTDYHAVAKLTIDQIHAQLEGEHHVCITGGEPIMHPYLMRLLEAFSDQMCHIETSGVFSVRSPYPQKFWITVSPKFNCCSSWIKRADEVKVLIGPNYKTSTLEYLLGEVSPDVPIFLQPINGVGEADKDNENIVRGLLKRYPQCRMSAQLHKYLGVR